MARRVRETPRERDMLKQYADRLRNELAHRQACRRSVSAYLPANRTGKRRSRSLCDDESERGKV